MATATLAKSANRKSAVTKTLTTESLTPLQVRMTCVKNGVAKVIDFPDPRDEFCRLINCIDGMEAVAIGNTLPFPGRLAVIASDRDFRRIVIIGDRVDVEEYVKTDAEIRAKHPGKKRQLEIVPVDGVLIGGAQ